MRCGFGRPALARVGGLARVRASDGCEAAVVDRYAEDHKGAPRPIARAWRPTPVARPVASLLHASAAGVLVEPDLLRPSGEREEPVQPNAVGAEALIKEQDCDRRRADAARALLRVEEGQRLGVEEGRLLPPRDVVRVEKLPRLEKVGTADGERGCSVRRRTKPARVRPSELRRPRAKCAAVLFINLNGDCAAGGEGEAYHAITPARANLSDGVPREDALREVGVHSLGRAEGRRVARRRHHRVARERASRRQQQPPRARNEVVRLSVRVRLLHRSERYRESG